MKKPWLQGKILNLPPEQLERLHEMFRENLTYADIRSRMLSEFGFSIQSSSLSRYYQQNASEFMFDKPGGAVGGDNAQPIAVEPGGSRSARFNIVLHVTIVPQIVHSEAGSQA